MTKRMLFVCITLMAATAVSGQSKKDNKQTQLGRYDIFCAGTGTEGTYLVEVSAYSSKQANAEVQILKNAVHGVIFKGVAGKSGGCSSQPPLASTSALEQQNADFFARFFSDEGDFRKYASVVGLPQSVKMEKEYKSTATVSVSKDQLRRDLEATGVVRKLTQGF